MSVVEFTVSFALASLCLFAGHETIRLISLERSAAIIIQSAASKASISSLVHIARRSFEGDGRHESAFESHLEKTLKRGLRSPILHWSFFSEVKSSDIRSIVGIRSYARGPTIDSPLNDVELSAHICVSSWFENLSPKLTGYRNCLGQFSPRGTDGKKSHKGLLLSVSARRSVPYWVPTFFLGFRHD